MTAKTNSKENQPVAAKACPSRRKAALAVSDNVSAQSAILLRPYLVGIGPSAGGLEAFPTLIAALPTDLGISCVVLQHLSPTQRRMMVQLPGRESAMAVRGVEHGG